MGWRGWRPGSGAIRVSARTGSIARRRGSPGDVQHVQAAQPQRRVQHHHVPGQIQSSRQGVIGAQVTVGDPPVCSQQCTCRRALPRAAEGAERHRSSGRRARSPGSRSWPTGVGRTWDFRPHPALAPAHPAMMPLGRCPGRAHNVRSCRESCSHALSQGVRGRDVPVRSPPGSRETRH